jgi:hypothetical protein
VAWKHAFPHGWRAAVGHVGDVTSRTERLVSPGNDDAPNRAVGHELRNVCLKALLDRRAEGIHSFRLVEPQQGDAIPVFDDYRAHVSLPVHYIFDGSGQDIGMRREMKLDIAPAWDFPAAWKKDLRR